MASFSVLFTPVLGSRAAWLMLVKGPEGPQGLFGAMEGEWLPCPGPQQPGLAQDRACSPAALCSLRITVAARLGGSQQIHPPSVPLLEASGKLGITTAST